ncbi:MAG: flavin reductase [Oscillospiraceae bacterium]|nr:flavin reductase [Oscillospiraceae bacterium]
MSYQKRNIREIENPVKLIADDWALLSAGAGGQWNTMTVSWGGIGEIWGFDAAFVFVRPQRYTYQFMERAERFTLSFFGGGAKDALALCGKLSGRDTDKIAQAGLTAHWEDGAVWPEEAELVIVCEKAAAQDIDPRGFIDPKIESNYNGDYHRMYVGKIVGVWAK